VSRFLANVAILTIFGRILMVVQHMGLAYVENIFQKIECV
jgi:hypothetical protein